MCACVCARNGSDLFIIFLNKNANQSRVASAEEKLHVVRACWRESSATGWHNFGSVGLTSFPAECAAGRRERMFGVPVRSVCYYSGLLLANLPAIGAGCCRLYSALVERNRDKKSRWLGRIFWQVVQCFFFFRFLADWRTKNEAGWSPAENISQMRFEHMINDRLKSLCVGRIMVVWKCFWHRHR